MVLASYELFPMLATLFSQPIPASRQSRQLNSMVLRRPKREVSHLHTELANGQRQPKPKLT